MRDRFSGTRGRHAPGRTGKGAYWRADWRAPVLHLRSGPPMIRDGMRSVVGSLFGIASVVLIGAAILLLNGGYVYRTQCPRVGGSTETDWSYRIFAIVPYLGYSRSGCQVHTATRIALDAVGIWKLHDRSSSVNVADHRGEYTIKQDASMDAHCVSAGKSRSFCVCARDELTRRFTPNELSQISSVTRFDQLPAGLARRASDVTKAIDQGC